VSEDFDGGAFCVCDFDGDWRGFGATRPKARKRHRCDECGMHIEPGEIYERYTGLSEGDFYVNKTCPSCLAIIDWIQAHVPCFCRLYAGLWEMMHDYLWSAQEADPGFFFGLKRRIVLHRRISEERYKSSERERAARLAEMRARREDG